MESRMKRFVTNDDLLLLATKTSRLRKMIRLAHEAKADLDVENGYMKAADRAIGRLEKRLRKRTLTKKQRAKLEWQINEQKQLCYCAQLEHGKKLPYFNGPIYEIESVLRELTAISVAN
jgi:hypothetical protein